jgi:GT2 family glycosyltransferase
MRARSLSFLIPTHARRDTLRGVLRTLERQAGEADIPIDIVVVDDASTDGTSTMLAEEFSTVTVQRNEVSRGFDALGDAVHLTRGDLIFCLDDDAYPDDDTVEKVLDHFERRGERLGLVALPFIEPASGRTVYTPYLPTMDQGPSWAPTHAFLAGAAVFRREVALAVPPSPPGYFLYCTEPATALEVLASGWEADHLPDAAVYHLFEARRAKIKPMQAILPFRNDLVTIRRYYRGWERFEMLIGRYLTGLLHLAAAGALGAFPKVHRESWALFLELGERDVSPATRRQVYRCFDGTTLRTLASETNRRRVAYALGRLPIDQVG